MHRRGFWLFSWEDAARVPVIRYDGLTIWLLGDGTYSFLDPAAGPG